MPERNLVLRLAMSAIPERPSKTSVVEGCSLFNSLGQDARQDLIERSFLAYAERGEMIWSAGAPADFVAIVGVGFVKMTKATHHGQEVAVEMLGPGQCFGLLAAIEGRTFPLAAVAVTNAWYLKIPSRTLLPHYQASGAFKDLVVRNLGPRL
ncbi:MAG TPA: cyclic nucleotide-binding domain-containing protein, partial [Fimbriimonadaceae bacterium]|nr:cyclic nucleotide-binding domain-containing protein [Fimbriimonadaceae bacterium]